MPIPQKYIVHLLTGPSSAMVGTGRRQHTNLASFSIIEAFHQGDDGGLAAARLTHQSQATPGLYLEAELVEDLHLRAGGVPEAHTAQLHAAPTLAHLPPCTHQCTAVDDLCCPIMVDVVCLGTLNACQPCPALLRPALPFLSTWLGLTSLLFGMDCCQSQTKGVSVKVVQSF